MPLVEEKMGTLRVLTIDNPSQRNAIGAAMRGELREALLRADADPACRALVLTGAQGHFCSGGDVGTMSAVVDLTGGRERVRNGQDLIHAFAGLAKPIVAAVEGWAAGGGMSLALLCDTIVAGEGAKFVSSFFKIGLVPDLGIMHTLPRRVGPVRAQQIFMYGEVIEADAALAMGLVDDRVERGDALRVAIEKAKVLAAVAPLSIGYTKQWHTRGLQEVMHWERDSLAALYLSADHAEGREAFLQKRKANFVGR